MSIRWLVKLRITFPYPQEGLADEDSLQRFKSEIPVFHPASVTK